MRTMSRIISLVFAVVLVSVALPGRALADDAYASHLDVTANLAADGTLAVTQVLTFGAGKAPTQVVQKLPARKATVQPGYYLFDYANISASAGGVDLKATVTKQDEFVVVTVGTAAASGQPITISYTVKGAVQADASGAALLSWRMLQGLSVGVDQVTGTMSAPAMLTSLDCTAGPPNTLTKCQTYAGGTHEAPQPTFTDGPRGPGETVSLEVVYPADQVAINQVWQQRWTLDRAFSTSPAALLGALGVLLLGGACLWLVHRRYGVDRGSSAPTPVAEFTPVSQGRSVFTVLDGVRPGHIGTVADERVDPIDITATLLDLAVRGHLRIHELPSEPGRPLDWGFERLPADAAELRPYEVLLLDAVAPRGPGACTVSSLASTLAPVIGPVQRELYDEVVERGWFERRPDAIRGSWTKIGRVSLALAALATVVLAAFTTLGLIGLSLVAVALGLLWVSERMPRRTAAGSALLGGLTVLSGVLQTHPTDQMPVGEEYVELSKLLPYAVVLGGKDRWLAALVEADDDPGVADPTDLDWYHAPDTWHLRDLPTSLRAFVTTVQGELFSR